MIDHISLPSTNSKRTAELLEPALAALGYEVMMSFPGPVIGMGAQGVPDFWIVPADGAVHRVHVAFRATTRAEVDAFHAAALVAGATDNGAPGLRPQYHEHYYGAFVLDPDGHNIEAVCQTPVEE